MATHGFGIIGCGMIAEFHTRAINEIEGARVVAAFESVPGQRREDRRAGRRRLPGLRRPRPDARASRASTSSASARPAARTWTRPSQAAQRGQARRGREAAGDHPAAVRRDHRRLRRGRRPALHDLPLAVLGGQHRRSRRRSTTGRFGRLTLGDTYVKWWRTQEYYDSGGWRGHLGARRRRRLMNQAIHNVDLLQWLMGDVDTIMAHDRHAWPTSGSRSRTPPSPSSGSRTGRSA